MPIDLTQLVRDTVDLTGVAAPSLLDPDAPILQTSSTGADDFYLVGVIGGKDVGKSSLINALVGSPVTHVTSHGPGTQQAIAYAHASQVDRVKDLLDREIPGRFSIVSHEVTTLNRQVLLDLPDVDSHYEANVAITRAILRRLLFPIWMQSVEKYADDRPQRLLKQVADGNDPGNFLFVLAKADQLPEPAQATELAGDFAARVARTLVLGQPPQIYVVSVREPHRFDLATLRETLSRQKETDLVDRARASAAVRQAHTLIRWLDTQQLPARALRLQRLTDALRETLTIRIVTPILERTLPGLATDPARRVDLVDAVTSAQVRAWPLVGIAHTLLSPLMSMVRANLAPARLHGFGSTENLVESHLPHDGLGLVETLQASFAQLQHTHGDTTTIYGDRPLWNLHPAQRAIADLRTRLSRAIDLDRADISRRLQRSSLLLAPVRWLLTIGAILWFPLVQPACELLLTASGEIRSASLALLVVQTLSVSALLKNLVFLLIWFVVIDLTICWSAHRRVTRLLARSAESDAAQGLSRVVLEWVDDLIQPASQAHARTAGIIEALDQARVSYDLSVDQIDRQAKRLL